MSKKAITKLREELFEVLVKKAEEVEAKINSKARVAMVDPETVAEATESFRSLGSYIQNLNSVLLMAIEAREEFYQIYQSRKTLAETLEKTISEIEKRKELEVEELICKYKSKIQENKPLLEILTWTKGFLELPRSKKNQKRWKKNNWGLINQPFYPFIKIAEDLQVLEEFIEENL